MILVLVIFNPLLAGCEKENNLPLNGNGQFVGTKNDVDNDYYLWLTGQAANWFRGEGSYGIIKPVR